MQIIVIIFGSLNVIASTIHSFAEYIIVSDKFEWHQQIMSIYVKRNLLTAFKWPFCNKFKWLCDFLLLLVEIYLLFALIECVLFTYCSAIFRNHKMMKQIAHWLDGKIGQNSQSLLIDFDMAIALPKYFTVNPISQNTSPSTKTSLCSTPHVFVWYRVKWLSNYSSRANSTTTKIRTNHSIWLNTQDHNHSLWIAIHNCYVYVCVCVFKLN